MLKNFRKALAKIIFDKKKDNIDLDMSKVKSILILRDDNKIGDMAISTILFREIKKQYPNIKIYVLAGNSNKELIKYNPYIEKIFVIKNSIINNLFIYRKIRKYKIDLLIDFIIFRPRPTYMLKLRLINPKFIIGFFKDSYNIYNKSLNVDYNNNHISNMYVEVLKYMKIYNVNNQYDIFFSEYENDYAKEICNKFNSKKIVYLNTHSAAQYKTLPLKKTKQLIKLISNEQNIQIILNSKYNLVYDNVFIPDRKDLLSNIALIKYVDIVLTVDTSIVHISKTFDKKMVALYLDDSNRNEKINLVWAPNYKNAIQLTARPNSDINSIDNKLIIDTLKSFLN